MGTLRIEGDGNDGGAPTHDLSRERYDLLRRGVLEPKTVCHAPFSALHVGRHLAPCRHSALDLGDARSTSLAQGFTSEAVAQMRERFKQYVVRRDECSRCIHHWEDEAAAESPALAEYDRALPPLNGVAPRLHAISVDARVALPKARVDEVIALLPQLDHVALLCDSLEPAGAAQRVMKAADKLRSGPRPKLSLLAFGVVPPAATLPSSVTAVELHLPLAPRGLAARVKEQVAELADELAERGTRFRVATEVGRANWIELKRWLADVIGCGATPEVALVARDDPDSLAALDADLLAALHGVLYRWSRELGVTEHEERGATQFRNLLARLRQWQKLAADRPATLTSLAMPALDHALLRDEAETRHLLEEFLRVYHHPRVEQWLAELAQEPDFVRGAQERLSLRLAVLWLGCVFERSEVRPALRAIWESPTAAAARIAGDRALLAGGTLAGWHDGWVQSLELEKQPRAGAPFELPPPVTAAAAGRAQVTVIIPSYNHERFVGAAIDSVLAQGDARVRVLVVDDASTDDTVAVARTRKDPRIEVRRNPRNVGLGKSLLRALRGVRTPFVAILNSDDVFHPERVARLLDALQERPRAAIAASLLAPVDADGRACTIHDSSPVFDGKRVHDWLQWFEAACKAPPTSGDLLRPLLERNFLVTSSNLVARREFLLEHAPLWRDLDYCVDWQLFLAAAAQGLLRVVPEPLLAYRLHASNTVWFDEEREWRFYVESHRVVARTLELLLRRAKGDGATRFASQLELIANQLAGNDAIDGAGLYLGLLLERLHVPAESIRNEQNRRWIQTLESMRRMRLHVRDVVHVLGDNFSDFFRMRGERPFLRAARNQAEAIADELDRLKWQLQSALEERRNVEKLWRQAERERDQEIAGKADLFKRIGEVEGDLGGARHETEKARQEAETARRERAAKETELERMHQARGELQTALQAVQREHEQLRKELEHALGAIHAGQDRVKEDVVEGLKSVLSGHDSVRTELTGAVDRIREERERIEGGLTDTLHGVARERDRLKDSSTREREALRTSLERLHEETATLQDELERTRAALATTRQRAQAEQDLERAETLRRLEEERARLAALFEDERKQLQAALESEREEHARKVAAAEEAAMARLAETLAKEAAARIELAEEAAAQAAQERAQLEANAAAEQAKLAAQVAAAKADAAALALRGDQLAARAKQLEEEAARLSRLANQRTWERDAVKRAPEYRFGNLVLNKMKFRAPLRALEKGMQGARAGLASARLAGERRGLLGGGKGRPRILATVCWNFPIYSQTFVYQELTQMDRRGFELRLIYSKLDPREHLSPQFSRLWDLKRVMFLDRAIQLRDYAKYQARFPERVELLTQKLCAASGLPREAVVAHDNFLQGFTYARMAEAWGAEYLHSYFFYDRSLMSLIAGFVLGLPRGVSCYADHLLNDYELKMVPLHLETCEVIVATSARIKRELLSLVPGMNADKILVKPNAIDCTRFPVIPRVEPAPGEPFRLVVTSRIEPKKGLIYLVEAVKLLRDAGINVEAHFVGDVDKGVPASENCKAELCERIERYRLVGRVHLEGRQPEQGVRKFLSISQLFVAPFVETESGDKDGIPTALVEALATGLPAVVTDSGSILEVVDDRVDARVVPQRDPRALAAAILELLADPKGRRLMGHKAAQKAREQFDVSICEPRLHDRVRSILAARRK